MVLLTVDTLRPDHLSIYGYARNTDPNLARFAADGTVFLRAYTPRGKTTPSYASMFTGLYPYRHGLRTLGQGLAGANRTLAEILGRAGYTGHAFVSSTVMIAKLSNLDQGFDEWDDRMPVREKNRANYQRLAHQSVSALLTAFARNRKPAFWFLHLIDPHSPYRPPGSFGGQFHGGSKRRVDARAIGRARRLDGADTLGDYVNAYDGEIAYADAELGRLLTALRESGTYDRALIIFTADHGESLGEHNSWFRHGENLHEESMRVPLIVKPPKRWLRRPLRRWDGAVSLVDVVPTVLDYRGIREKYALDGLSLRPLVEGHGKNRERVVFSTKPSARVDDWAAHDRRGSLIATGCKKQLTPSEFCRMQYFDDRNDPGHRSPRSDGSGFERLAGALRSFVAKARSYKRPFPVRRIYNPADKNFVQTFIEGRGAGERGLSEQDRENLKSLGYL